MSYPDLAVPLRNAVLGSTDVTALLTAYENSYPVFTRRPAPTAAPKPMIMISPDIVVTDADGIADKRPLVTRDITVYGLNDTSAKYRAVESLGRILRDLFHRQWRSITVTDWKVVSMVVRGPIPAPTDDDQTIARMVTLEMQLAQQ